MEPGLPGCDTDPYDDRGQQEQQDEAAFDMIDLSSDALDLLYDNAVLGTVFDSSLHPVEQRQQRSSKAKVRGGEAHIGEGTAKRQKRSLACPVCIM